jgi:hypothetical protein
MVRQLGGQAASFFGVAPWTASFIAKISGINCLELSGLSILGSTAAAQQLVITRFPVG